MPRESPFVIELSERERATLERLAAKYTAPYRDVIRAKIVLMAARGMPSFAEFSDQDLEAIRHYIRSRARETARTAP